MSFDVILMLVRPALGKKKIKQKEILFQKYQQEAQKEKRKQRK